MTGIRNKKTPKETLEESPVWKKQQESGTWGGGARYLRRSPRIIQFATKVTVEFDEQIRQLADQEGIYIAEMLEKMLATYLYCKDKEIDIERERERERERANSPKKSKK